MRSIEEVLALGQAEKGAAGAVMQAYLRGVAREALLDVLADEVSELCGPKHGRGEQREYRRGGSAPGVVELGTRREDIRRPRVRRRRGDGEEEVRLASYEAAQDGVEVRAAILRALESGVSCRDQSRVYPQSRRCSKSEVSRLWTVAGKRRIEDVRGRELEATGYAVLMLDGVELGQNVTAIVALGITGDGRKQMLDFEVGASENAETATALCERLQQRGFKACGRRLLAVLDGSKALRKAVLAVWPKTIIQRCLVHLERNVRARLAYRWRNELAALFKALRDAADLEAAEEAYNALLAFVQEHTYEGTRTLTDARADALSLFRMGIGDGLNRALLSTNAIENSIRNMRGVLSRPTRWRGETDMPARWMAASMLKAESGFRRLTGHKHLERLIAALDSGE